MAGPYDVESQAMPYGSVGGAGVRTLQSELLRRAQLAELQRADEERQAQLRLQNERAARAETRQTGLDRLNERVTLDQLASNDEARKTLSEQRAEATKETERKAFVASNPIGTSTAAKRAEGERLGLGSLFLSKPSDMPNGMPGTQVDAAVLPGATPKTFTPPEDVQFAGTPEQQKAAAEAEHTAKQRKLVDDFVAGRLDDQFGDTDPQTLQAAKLVASMSDPTHAATAIASLMKPPKAPVEGAAADNLAIEKIFYDRAIAAGMDPAAAKVEARRKFNALQGEQARQRQDITVTTANQRQLNAFANQAEQSFATRVSQQDQKVQDILTRASRAEEMLAHKNFVSDALLAPEVLQSVAGGMGSGLRMTTAEINNVMGAQTKLQELAGAFKKATGLGEQTRISDEMRQNLAAAVHIVRAAQERKVQVDADIMRRLETATSKAEIRALEAEWFQETAKAGRGGQEPPTAAGALPAGIRSGTIR